MNNSYSQNTNQPKIENPMFVKLESRKLFMSFIMRPFY